MTQPPIDHSLDELAKVICEAYGEEWRTDTYKLCTGPNFTWEEHDGDKLNNGWRYIAKKVNDWYAASY